jgi:methyl-accepting chemotaxis protein
LYCLILSAVLGCVALSAVGIHQIAKVYSAASYTTRNTVPSLLEVDKAIAAITQLRLLTWQHIATGEMAKKNAIMKSMDVARASLADSLKRYAKNNTSDDNDKAMLDTERTLLKDYDAFLQQVLALSNAYRNEDAQALFVSDMTLTNRVFDAFETHRRYKEQLGNTGAAAAETAMRGADRIAVGIAAAVTLLVAVMGIMLTRKIVFSLHQAVRIAKTVAGGDLTMHINAASNDETGQLIRALKEMNDGLVTIVTEVRGGTDAIATAASEIASGNLDLSTRTEQQAGSLEETASAMEQLTSTVRQNAEHARQATQMAAHASETAMRGGSVVGEVIDTMQSINRSSNKIAEIINVIDAIAFQTNILALNAAVEAARAGEQGRGFAVVASEVRNLAQRSAAAAKEIKTLIVDSVEKVAQGGKLVERAGSTMAEVMDDVRRVTGVVNEIAAASQEQSAGIEEVSRAITQMDDVTQQNAALVEEAAAASQSLQSEAGNLARVVSVFKLAGGRIVVKTLDASTEMPLNAPAGRLADTPRIAHA